MIRRAGPADVPGLAALHAEAFPEPWGASDLAELVGADGVQAWAAEDGFILVRALAGEAEILTLAVRPAGRRQGQGRRLVEAAAAGAAQGGAESLFLEVAADNAAALALYAGCGFAPVGRRKGYYRRAHGPSMDALVLRRTLTAGTS